MYEREQLLRAYEKAHTSDPVEVMLAGLGAGDIGEPLLRLFTPVPGKPGGWFRGEIARLASFK